MVGLSVAFSLLSLYERRRNAASISAISFMALSSSWISLRVLVLAAAMAASSGIYHLLSMGWGDAMNAFPLPGDAP